MRKYFFILLLGPCLSWSQSKDQGLFMEIWEQCPQWMEDNLPQLKKDFKSQDSLEYYLELWELYCEPNLASIRQRILGDLQFKGALDSTDLSKFYRAQSEFLKYLSQQRDPYLEHWAFSRQKALSLLEQKDWPQREAAVLQLIAAKNYQAALDLHYQKKTKDLSDFEKSREDLETNNSEIVNFGLGYNYLMFNQKLLDELGAGHGLWLGVDFEYERNLASIAFAYNRTEKRSYLRILGDESVENTDLENFLQLDFNYGRALFSGRRHKMHIMVGAGLGSFTTDLYYRNVDDERVAVSITSYHFKVGLNYQWRIYGSRHIGLRSLLSMSNFNSDEDLRGDLQGQVLSTTLYYRF